MGKSGKTNNKKPKKAGKQITVEDIVPQSVFEVYDLRFCMRDVVYLKTDPDQLARIVTGVLIREDGIKYYLSCGMDETYHYGFEITKERDVVKATSS